MTMDNGIDSNAISDGATSIPEYNTPGFRKSDPRSNQLIALFNQHRARLENEEGVNGKVLKKRLSDTAEKLEEKIASAVTGEAVLGERSPHPSPRRRFEKKTDEAEGEAKEENDSPGMQLRTPRDDAAAKVRYLRRFSAEGSSLSLEDSNSNRKVD